MTATPAIAAHARQHRRSWPSQLARQMHYWQIKQHAIRGTASYDDLAAHYGISEKMVRYIVRTAEQPDLCGFDEPTALTISAAYVPLATARLLVDTHATATLAEQATLLNITQAATKSHRRRLTIIGVIDPNDSRLARIIAQKQAQEQRVVRLFIQGLTRKEVAEACEISEWYAHELADKHGGVKTLQERTSRLTLKETADLLGCHRDALADIIHDGYWQPARRESRVRKGRRFVQTGTRFSISRADICELLRCRPTWMRLSPATIRDPELRHYAEMQRAAAGGCWRTLPELAQLAGISRDTAWKWRKRGWLADWETMQWCQTTWYWHCNGVVLQRRPQ